MKVVQLLRADRGSLWGTTITTALLPLALAPLLFLAGLVVLKLLARPLYMDMIREDAIFEILTAVVYVLATGIFVATGLALRGRGEGLLGLSHLGFAALCFLVAMEEISWGQRIFKIQSPEFFAQHNIQQETNLHNFLDRYLLHGVYILISAGAAFGWLAAPAGLRWLPATIGEPLRQRLPFIVPDRQLMLYFLPCMLLYIYYDYVNPIQVWLWGPEWDIALGAARRFFFVSKDQEPIELLLATGFLVAGVLMLSRLVHTRTVRVK